MNPRTLPLCLLLFACQPTDKIPGTTSDSGLPPGTATGTGTGTATGSTNTTLPVAVDDAYTCVEGQLVDIQPLVNDSDPDDGLDLTTLTIVTDPAHGQLNVSPQGNIRYSHDGSEDATDSFTYTINDIGGQTSNIATVSFGIDPVNDPPVAIDDTLVVDEGGVAVVDVVSNDTDPDDGVDPGSIVVITQPDNGTLVVNANGTVQYTHDGSEEISDRFSYAVLDYAGATSNAAGVTISINPVNDPPVAVNDLRVVPIAGQAVLYPLTNDLDPDDGFDLASATVITTPLHGTAVAELNGTITYTHDGSANYTDSFTYRVSDLTGVQSNIATFDLVISDDACIPDTMDFLFTGGSAQFDVPCSGTFTIEAWGAQGRGGNGGLGGYASGTIDLVIGETLFVYPGGEDGWNGGGLGWAAVDRNGGGASDVRRNGTSLADRILVAGGGGGGGPTDVGNHMGGDGGGGTCGVNYCGGGGAEGYGGVGDPGGLMGGIANVSCHSGGAGGGGLQSGGDGSCNTCYTNSCGTNGALGDGGPGDTWENGICFSMFGGTSGGGGGYYGGGGSSVGNCGSGGGGGGSSWTGTLYSPLMTPGVQVGSGQVTITW